MKREKPFATTKIRHFAQQFDMRISENYLDELSYQIYAIVEKSIKRAKLNGRVTLRPQDL